MLMQPYPCPQEANTSGWAATCRDWYVDGGVSGQGSCCQQDDAVFMAYCGSADAASDPLYPIACDPTHPGEGAAWMWRRSL